MTDVFLAVDLGKTRCRVALRASGVCSDAEGAGAPGLATREGMLAAEATVRAVVRPMLQAAGVASIDRACIGAAGALAVPDLAAKLAERLAATLPARETAITSDVITSHAGAVRGDGLVLCIGTGSVALALANGRMRRADGWGPLLGDEGSGGWIGLQGLRSALRGVEGRGPKTTLQDALERLYGPIATLPAAVCGAADAARFALEVAQAASSGDAVAAAILRDAAERLAATARSAAAILPRGASCAVVGGLQRLGPPLMDRLTELLGASGLTLVPAAGTALDGGLLLADRTDMPHEAHVFRTSRRSL